MRKKILSVLTAVSVLVIVIFALTACSESYAVTWKNWDGTVLETDVEVEEGVIPTYDGTTPTKTADAQYSYEFSGWDKETTPVTGETVYTAKFDAILNSYTVTWENWDRSVLEIDKNINYGTMPTYNGATPTKQADAQYTYTFSGWDSNIDIVTGDITYTAQFSNVTNTYNVTWQNWDGSVLELDENVEYGTTPTYDGETPTKEGNAQYTYTFSNWTPVVDEVTGDVTYVAQFTDSINKYTVTWENWDGTILEFDENVAYGTMPTYDGMTPTKAGNAQYSYAFIGWTPVVDVVTANVTYVAQFSNGINKYTVTWKNWDGTVLEVDENIDYGTLPNYDGMTPTRQADAQYTYTFSRWEPTIDTVTGSTTYIAQYSYVVNKYSVTWKNWDGTVLEVDENVPYGTMPTYDGNIPTREKDVQYTYNFSGWDKTVGSVRGDITYTAKYSNTVNKYTIVWKNYDGIVLKTDSVDYGTKPVYTGEIPTKEGDAQYGWSFSGWTPNIVNVTGNAEYVATFTVTTNKYTITWKNYDGTVLETDAEVSYGTIPAYNGNAPVKPCDSLNKYTFEGWTPNIVAVNGDAVYVAVFSVTESNAFTIKYDANGGTGAPSSQTKNKGQNITLSSKIPTYDEHVFIGWYCAYDGNTYSKGSSFSVEANVTLYAVWGHDCYTCEGSGTVTSTTTCSSCSGLGTYSKTETKEVMCSSCGGTGSYSVPSTCSSCKGGMTNIIIYCSCNGGHSWPYSSLGQTCPYCGKLGKILSYSTCGSCGGDGIKNTTTRCSSCYGNGYKTTSHTATYTCSSCNGSGTIITTKTCSSCDGDKVIVDTYSSYTLILKDYDLTIATLSVTVNTSYKLTVPTRVGYTFVGWFDAQENGKQYTDRNGVSLIVWDEENDKTLYAHWIENYTITYNLDGGIANNKVSYNIETSTFTLNNPTRTGYKFIGWSGTDIDGMSMEVVIPSISTGYREYTAHWAINQYTISFVAMSGQEFDRITQDYSTAIVLPKPTWSERSFVGWFDESLTMQFTSETMPAENITLYAKWIDYEVSLIVGNIAGISINDDFTDASVYGVIAIDTDNNPVKVTAQLLSGSQTAGTSITVRFVANGLYGAYDMQTVSDIKVYGMPTIQYDKTKDYINASDSLVASLFTATATDTYGETLSVNVSIQETEYSAGDTITIILSANDITGNTTVIEIENVKYYGTPTIVRDETVTEIKESDTIGNELFGVSAIDSFGVPLTVTTVKESGTFAGGYIITIKSSTTDSKGNTSYITYNVKVYGLPTITSATKTNFKEGEDITLSSLGVVAKDSFGNVLENVELSLIDGTYTAGNILTYLVTATDHLGNVNTKTISAKVYGAPTITYDINKTAIKATDKISASLLSATAKDSFGNALTVTTTLESGKIKGGSRITVKLVTTDSVGNTYSIITDEIKVYAQSDIVLAYDAALSNNIKKMSCGEEFNAIATDSFGEACTISVVPADGHSLMGGTTISLYLIAMDKAGNTYTSEIITEKNVYDTPVLSYAREYDYIMPSDNPYLLFSVKDSFGAERLFNVEIVSGSLQELRTIVYRITAEDKVGNKLDCTYSISVIAYDENGFLVCEHNGLMTLIDYPSSENIVVPSGVQVFSKELFMNDKNVKSIILPDTFKQIADYEFSGCNNLTSIVIPNSVTSIGYSAFYGCSSLMEMTLPFVGAKADVTTGDNQYPFGYIFGTNSYEGGVSTNQNYYNANLGTTPQIFYYIPASLKKVTITGSDIPNHAFQWCKNLTSIVIGNSVTSIGKQAIYGCSSLASVVIGSGVTSIREYAFYSSWSLTTVYYSGTSSDWAKIAIYSKNEQLTNATFYYYREQHPTAQGNYWNFFDGEPTLWHSFVADWVIVSEPSCGVSGIKHKVCNVCNQVVAEENMIPYHNFKDGYCEVCGCEFYTKELQFELSSDGTSYIVSKYSGAAIDVVIPSLYNSKPVTQIWANAFYNCGNIESVVIPNTIISIGSSAFSGCSNLKSITIPNGVTSISESAFSGCSNLNGIIIPSSVTSIGNYAFSRCGIKTITIPNSVTSIGTSAFSGCENLTSITIPNSVTSLGAGAFRLCTRLTKVIIGNGVTSINPNTFYGCSKLASITISKNVTSIGSYAFYNCFSLDHVYYSGTSSDRSKMSIGSYNVYFTDDPTWHYNSSI